MNRRGLFLLAPALALAGFFAGCQADSPSATDDERRPGVNGVKVAPSSASVPKGNTRSFSATVNGTDGPSQAVTWSVTGGGDGSGTEIDTNGVLIVDSNETAASLTVRAASTGNTDIYGTAAVIVLPATKDITGFIIDGIAGVIDSGQMTVTVTLPYGTNLTSLSPQIEHNGASVSPASGAARDFTSPVSYTVTAKDGLTAAWTVGVIPGNLDTIAKIDAYLSCASGGGSADSPIPLPVELALPDAGEGWAALLSKIQEKGKYVALDLSACTMAGTEFDPGAANTGENRIASLVLPAPAESIKAGTCISPAFRNFTALKGLGGANVTAVGDYAFYNCDALAAVSLPAATSVGVETFWNCVALATVNLPAAASIGDYTFRGCDALETVSLPAATSVGSGAFIGCRALAAVNLPAAASIGYGAFSSCYALATLNIHAVTNIGADVFEDPRGQALTITMGQAAPSVSEIGIKAFSTFSKDVTIRTPASPAGYSDTWQTNFKKAFGVGSGSYTVTINLGFETITP